MIDQEFTDPYLITAGYEGEPGARTFFIQVEDEEQRLTIRCEKEQVAGLGNLLADLLARIDDTPADDWDRDALALRPPLEPAWAAGTMQVGLDVERGRFVIEIEEFLPDEDDVDPVLAQGRGVRIWANQDQARRFAAHAEEVVGQGRPRCQLCGRPTDTDGTHVCPATNGHGRLAR